MAGLRPAPAGSVTLAFFTVEELISLPPPCCGMLSETARVAEESVGALPADAVTFGANGAAPQLAIGTGGVVGVLGVTAPAWLSSSRWLVDGPLQGLGRLRNEPVPPLPKPPAWPLKTSRFRARGGEAAMPLMEKDSW